jgi:excisionase family DNA binding protein
VEALTQGQWRLSWKEKIMQQEPSNSVFEPLVDALAEAIVRKQAALKANEPVETNELLTAEELAKHLKVPKTWVYEQARQKKLPTVQVGRYVRFDLKAVLAYLAKQN